MTKLSEKENILNDVYIMISTAGSDPKESFRCYSQGMLVIYNSGLFDDYEFEIITNWLQEKTNADDTYAGYPKAA